jgi:hypothetical protein
VDQHERFKALFKKFIEGTRWLNKKMMDGSATQKDKDDFQRSVVEPLDEMWGSFNDEEKAYWDKVRYAVDLFDGTIVDEAEEERKLQREEKQRKKKRWRKYSRSY